MAFRGLAIFVISLVGIESAYAGTCVKYEPAVISLTGIVLPKQFYGPPNYGEDPAHDEKGIAAILKLDEPVHVCGTRDNEANPAAAEAVSQMQMVFHTAPYGRQWNGKYVVVTGTLFPAITGHHHTSVLIDVSQIHLAGREKP